MPPPKIQWKGKKWDKEFDLNLYNFTQSRCRLHLYHLKLLWGISTSKVEALYNNKPVYQRWDLLLVVFLLRRNYAKPSSRHFMLPWQPIFPAGLWPLMTTVRWQEKIESLWRLVNKCITYANCLWDGPTVQRRNEEALQIEQMVICKYLHWKKTNHLSFDYFFKSLFGLIMKVT